MYRFAALKSLKHIFLLIFLGGMLYTVFNYVPLIEEEVSSKKHEQASSGKHSDGEPEGPEDENEGGHEDLFHMPGGIHFSVTANNSLRCLYLNSAYIPPLTELCTPPPRITA